MAHRTVLTERQRSALFDLPTDRTVMLRHYTLADDDLEIIRARRRPHNRFGFALQLCALRYPGRLLTPGEVIPMEVTRFLAAQLGLKSDDVAGYASREETRHEHLAALRNNAGRPRPFCRGSRLSNAFARMHLSLPSDGLIPVLPTSWMMRCAADLTPY